MPKKQESRKVGKNAEQQEKMPKSMTSKTKNAKKV